MQTSKYIDIYSIHFKGTYVAKVKVTTQISPKKKSNNSKVAT